MQGKKIVVFFKDAEKYIQKLGGKGTSLVEMASANVPVPNGFVILTSVFDNFLRKSGLLGLIETQIAAIDPEDLDGVIKASVLIQRGIKNGMLSKDIEQKIYDGFDQLGAKFVAVRSSATVEDSAVASWAGELDTFLNIEKNAIILKVKECWASLFTPRAILYSFENKMPSQQIGVAIVIQKMIESDVSGVAFTVHPVTRDYTQMLIEAGCGLGEAIVGGQITPDNYLVSKSDLSIVDIHVGRQKRKLVRNYKERTNDQNNIWINLGFEGRRQKLNNEQIINAARQFKSIEEHYGFPCDIEWAMERGKLYIIQSRPITTLD